MPEFVDWTRAFAMMGDSPVGYKVVLLAEDGSMYALLQGETAEGVFQTVRLDSEGRMSAFVIDSVDAWTRMLTIGNAELAVRLGSPNIYDRRGQVLFLDTFEQGLYTWNPFASGGSADVSLSPLAALASGYSVKLTGGNTTDWYAKVEKVVPSRPVGRMGMEFSLSMPTAWNYMQATFYLYTGTQALWGVIRWIYTGYVLQVYDHGSDYVGVGVGKVLGADAEMFNTIKFVVDTDTLKYVRMMFNNQEIAVSTRNLFAGADTTTSPSLKVAIELLSRDGFNDAMYLDNVIVTAAEPE